VESSAAVLLVLGFLLFRGIRGRRAYAAYVRERQMSSSRTVVGLFERSRPRAARCGRCVISSRFAPEASYAAHASSSERWPAGWPSSSPALERRLAQEEVDVARELGELSLGPQSPE
jgi:hypothetical protein